LFLDASDRTDADQLDLEERVVGLLARVLRLAYADQLPALAARQLTLASELADRVKRWVAPRVSQRLTLNAIARAVNCSVFHLCRSFRRATGMTLHAYRDEVRLRLALERIGNGERDLTRLALDLGYSSYSHFTAAFRRSFGVPPSGARKLLIVRR
jgi:AraC-like DNA-binding protein